MTKRETQKMIFLEHWIEENFALDEFEINSPSDFIVVLKDKNGSEMTVELVGNTIFAGGKPMVGIPSLSF